MQCVILCVVGAAMGAGGVALDSALLSGLRGEASAVLEVAFAGVVVAVAWYSRWVDVGEDGVH